MDETWWVRKFFESPQFLTLVDVSGKWSFVAVILGLAFHYWNVFQLQNIPIPHFVDILWGYLIFNGLVATTIKFLENRNRSSKKVCPKCGNLLEIDLNFRCPECGTVRFEK